MTLPHTRPQSLFVSCESKRTFGQRYFFFCSKYKGATRRSWHYIYESRHPRHYESRFCGAFTIGLGASWGGLARGVSTGHDTTPPSTTRGVGWTSLLDATKNLWGTRIGGRLVTVCRHSGVDTNLSVGHSDWPGMSRVWVPNEIVVTEVGSIVLCLLVDCRHKMSCTSYTRKKFKKKEENEKKIKTR